MLDKDTSLVNKAVKRIEAEKKMEKMKDKIDATKAKPKAKTNYKEEDLIELLEKAQARIRVVGCGGGGCNTIQSMSEVGIVGAETYAINSDAQDLLKVAADRKILIGRKLTRGLGAGSDPSVGEAAARESLDELIETFATHLVRERGLSPNTVAAYRRDLAHLIEFLATRRVRGPGGGYLLAKKPSEVSIGEIFMAVDENLILSDCVDNNSFCSKTHKCLTQVLWQKVTDSLKKTLYSISLNEVCSEAISLEESISRTEHGFIYHI